MTFCLIYVTCKDEEEASHIAQNLVESGLVACANILPKIKSVYKWEAKVCEDTEAVLIVKTKKENYASIEKKIKELHSYDCPCILSFDISQGNKEFLEFITRHCEEGLA